MPQTSYWICPKKKAFASTSRQTDAAALKKGQLTPNSSSTEHFQQTLPPLLVCEESGIQYNRREACLEVLLEIFLWTTLHKQLSDMVQQIITHMCVCGSAGARPETIINPSNDDSSRSRRRLPAGTEHAPDTGSVVSKRWLLKIDQR